jgi:hypothetical protein
MLMCWALFTYMFIKQALLVISTLTMTEPAKTNSLLSVVLQTVTESKNACDLRTQSVTVAAAVFFKPIVYSYYQSVSSGILRLLALPHSGSHVSNRD